MAWRRRWQGCRRHPHPVAYHCRTGRRGPAVLPRVPSPCLLQGRSRAFCSGASQHLQDGGQRHLPPNDGYPVRHSMHCDEGLPSSPAAQAHLGHLDRTEGSAPVLEMMSGALRRLLLFQQHWAWEDTLHRAAVAESRGSLCRAGTRRKLFCCFVD